MLSCVGINRKLVTSPARPSLPCAIRYDRNECITTYVLSHYWGIIYLFSSIVARDTWVGFTFPSPEGKLVVLSMTSFFVIFFLSSSARAFQNIKLLSSGRMPQKNVLKRSISSVVNRSQGRCGLLAVPSGEGFEHQSNSLLFSSAAALSGICNKAEKIFGSLEEEWEYLAV